MAELTKDKIIKLYKKTIKNDLKEKSKNFECNIVVKLWENPQLYLDYNILESKNFINDIWKIYFSIGKKMVEKGYSVFSDVDTSLFLQNSSDLKTKYEEFGGFNKVSDLFGISSEDNLEVFINNIKKYSSLYSIIDTFSFTEDLILKMNSYSLDNVCNYFNAKLNDIFVNVSSGVITSKLNEGLGSIIEKANEGIDLGLPIINSPILSNNIKGWRLGQITIFAGLSGTGKSSWIIDVLFPSIFESGEPVVIMLNEQDNIKFKQQFMTYIINNIILKESSDSFESGRWLEGGFSAKELEWLNKAKEIIEEKESSNKMIIAELVSYSRKTAERIIKKYANLGIKRFVLDTFKLSCDNSDMNESSWLSMMQDMVAFDDLVKPSNLNVSLLCTMQLQKGARMNRFLSVDNLAMAKNVIDVASVALLMRRLYPDEYPSQNHELKVFNYIEGTSIKQEVTLNPEKDYCIIFIDKNRNGSAQKYQIVCEQDLGKLTYKEVGICNIMPD